jgi:hypothetical protein
MIMLTTGFILRFWSLDLLIRAKMAAQSLGTTAARD